MKRLIQSILRKLGYNHGASVPSSVSPLLRHINPSYLLPPEALIRLGTVYGGWNLPRSLMLLESSVCYLAGAGEDVSFDCELVRLFKCSACIIDPTPRAIRHFEELTHSVTAKQKFSINGSDTDFYDVSQDDLTRLCFLPYGLAGQDSEQEFYYPSNVEHVSCSIVNLQKTTQSFRAQCYRLATLMAIQGDVRLDLLKMNIEGAEYEVIDDLVASNLIPATLLIVFDEGHTPMDELAPDRISRYVMKLSEAGMRCVAIEGCNATFIKS